MLALYRSGRQAEALRAFGRTRDMLVERPRVDPSPELRELERRILVHDRDLLIAVGPKVQRRAVLVADIDDAGWRDPAEREIAFARRETNWRRPPAATQGQTGAEGHRRLRRVRRADPRRAGCPGHRQRSNPSGDRRRRSRVREEEPVGPPLARAARLVAVAHPGQVILSSTAHDALAGTGEAGWAAESLGRFDIVGLDPGVQALPAGRQRIPRRLPRLCIDRLPPPVPDGVERSVPGYELRR